MSGEKPAASREDEGRRLVFISHSSADTWVARQIAREVESRGAATFLDEAAIAAGSDFEADIRAALEHADELVVLLTPWALDRPYVSVELAVAWFRRIRIVGILHGLTPSELQVKSGVPVFVKSLNLLSINQVDRFLRELEERIAEPETSRGGLIVE